MSRKIELNRLRPSLAEQSKLEAQSKAITKDADEGWLHLMSEADHRLKSDLFNNPPEKFVARIWDGSLVYGNLIANELLTDKQHLAYLMERDGYFTVVYVYSGRSAHQRNALGDLWFSEYGDWRLVPTSFARVQSELHITAKCAWELLPFHIYFNLPWFPEGDYYN